ncbi:uncharacterized protein [Anabrus simplex]|uniref:uncharacterized protein n=1 Tax=Anabrus simplex TaxID=316456 RepID=UPI0035A2E633
MMSWNKPCNCSDTLADKPIYRVTGFPTCYQPPLPHSLCAPRGVCGVAHCEGRTVFHQIQSVVCDPNCVGQQPFCERLGPLTTAPRRITSAWSDWSAPKCNATCGKGSIITEATCIDKESGKRAQDCIGPGVYCCSPQSADCECHVHYGEDGLKVTRILAACESLPPCLGEEYTNKDGTREVNNDHSTHDWMENISKHEDERQHLKQVAELPPSKFEVRAHLRTLLQVKSEDGHKKIRAIGHDLGETIYDYKELEQSESINQDNVLSMRVGNGDEIEKEILKELVDQPYEVKLQKKSSGMSLLTRKPSFVCIIMGTVSTIKNINK